MNKKTVISSALLLTLGTASAAPITSLEVTGGYFSMAGSGGELHPAAYANMSVDGSYDGGTGPGCGCIEVEQIPYSIMTFEFGFFGGVGVFTAATDLAGNGPYPGVTGDLTGNSLTLDLRSWTAYWNGVVFNQGGAGVTATTDGAGNFTASWMAPVVGGPFNGQTGSWTLQGVVSAVPAPAAAWLFGSGLLCLIGVARRRRVAL